MYGLPKIHKVDIPIRPIINGINNPNEKLTNFINPSLSPLNNNNPYDIKNALELKEKIKDLNIDNNDIILSLDIVSLFTNIPLDYLIKILSKKWNEIEPHTSIKCKNTFLKVIKFICNNNYFLFNKQVYRQLNGTPMGSSISINLSGIVINSLLNEVIPNYNNEIKLISKYVDDLLLIVNKSKSNEIINKLNSLNKKIQFTSELENNNKIDYLDITIIKNKDGKLETKWYEKDIKKGQILNYHSQHPFEQKRNVIENTINRAIKLTDKTYLPEIKKYIFSKFEKNLYPHKLINKAWNKIINKMKNDNSIINQANHDKALTSNKFHCITYIKGLTGKIINDLKVIDTNTRWGKKTNNKIKSKFYTTTIDKSEILNECNVVYSIPCNDCDKSYIGETSQNLYKRMKQHEYDVKNKKTNTGLASHVKEENHSMNINNVKILDKERNVTKRRVLEAIHIANNKTVNFKEDASEVVKFYGNILNNFR